MELANCLLAAHDGLTPENPKFIQHYCGLITLSRGIILHICCLTGENGEIDRICVELIQHSRVL